VPVKAWRG